MPFPLTFLHKLQLRPVLVSLRALLPGRLLMLCCLLLPAYALAIETPDPAAIAGGPAVDPAASTGVVANLDAVDPLENMTLDDALQKLKKDVLALNRDLFILKEELLFPAHTQVGVFLSLDVGEFFELDAVNISLNDKQVASHLYTPRQTNALMRGGVQRLYLGNIKNGEHEITAVFTGRGPQGRDYRRASTLTFAKGDEATHLEVKITDSGKLLQPEFTIVEWN